MTSSPPPQANPNPNPTLALALTLTRFNPLLSPRDGGGGGEAEGGYDVLEASFGGSSVPSELEVPTSPYISLYLP